MERIDKFYEKINGGYFALIGAGIAIMSIIISAILVLSVDSTFSFFTYYMSDMGTVHNGADIVFNPSATVAGLSEHLWSIEQPAHAVANGYYVAAINRVGEEPWKTGTFYGSSYVVDPRGQIIKQGSRDKEDLVVIDIDLDLIREVRDTWQFYRDRRPETYFELTDF